MQKNLVFKIPTLDLPCGEVVALPLALIAQLKAAGVRQLEVEECWACHREHLVDLPDMSTVLFSAESPLLMTQRANGA